jgi:hypothetical protein
MSDIIGTGFDFPFRFENGRVKTSRPLRDVTPEDNKHAIKISIEQILGTSKGERVMLREFGSNLNELLFEPQGPELSHLIKSEVVEAIGEWEERVQLVEFSFEYVEPSKVVVKLTYKIIPTSEVGYAIFPLEVR